MSRKQTNDKYSEMEQTFSELKRQGLLNETQGLVPAHLEKREEGLTS